MEPETNFKAKREAFIDQFTGKNRVLFSWLETFLAKQPVSKTLPSIHLRNYP